MKARTCPLCNGEGYYYPLIYGDWYSHEYTDCERCEGEGEIEVEEPEDDAQQ